MVSKVTREMTESKWYKPFGVKRKTVYDTIRSGMGEYSTFKIKEIWLTFYGVRIWLLKCETMLEK